MTRVGIRAESLREDSPPTPQNLEVWSRSFTRGERQHLTWLLSQMTLETINSIFVCHQINLLKLSTLCTVLGDNCPTPDYVSVWLASTAFLLAFMFQLGLILNPE